MEPRSDGLLWNKVFSLSKYLDSSKVHILMIKYLKRATKGKVYGNRNVVKGAYAKYTSLGNQFMNCPLAEMSWTHTGLNFP